MNQKLSFTLVEQVNPLRTRSIVERCDFLTDQLLVPCGDGVKTSRRFCEPETMDRKRTCAETAILIPGSGRDYSWEARFGAEAVAVGRFFAGILTVCSAAADRPGAPTAKPKAS